MKLLHRLGSTILLALLVLPLRAATSTTPADHAQWGLPWKSEASTKKILEKPYFTVGFWTTNREPYWVAYRLTADDVADNTDRNYNTWTDDTDPKVAGKQAPHEAYSSTWQRGHFCPYLHRRWSEDSYKATFVYTNCAPQFGTFNGGAWAKLEKLVASWTDPAKHGDIWVYTGVIYKPVPGTSQQYTPEGHLKIPSHFYCVVYDPTPEPQVIAFIYENKKPADSDPFHHLISVRELEKRAKVDFLNKLSRTVQDEIETEEYVGEWY